MANKAWISEYVEMAQGAQGQLKMIAKEPALVDQAPVDFTAGTTQSAAFNVKTKWIRVHVDSACHMLVGSNPSATTSVKRLAAGQTEYFEVDGGAKAAFVAAA